MMERSLYIFAVALVIGVIIGVIVAEKFESIANMKGHSGYFWWCLLLGLIGWAMVIALPDRGDALYEDKTGAYKEAENRDR